MSTLFRKSRSNPFDKTCLGAKIPDAKSTVSNALRFQGVLEQKIETSEATGILAFYAGVNNCFNLLDDDYGGVTAWSTTAATTGYFAEMPTVGVKEDLSGTPVKDSMAMEKWRLVSAGLRLQLLNNADKNDGWFEAIRVEPGYDDTDLSAWNMGHPAGAVADTDEVRRPIALAAGAATQDLLPKVESWVNHPTYVTGKLRDIHQYMWKLNSISLDHEYMSMGHTSTGGKENIDVNYDMVLIRLHGRDTGDQSQIVVHQVANYEVVFEAGTLLSTLATQTPGRTRASYGDATRPARTARAGTFGYTARRVTRRVKRTVKRKRAAPKRKRTTRTTKRRYKK